MDQRIGTVMAGYRIDELIGRGGMGVVYRAEDLRLRRRVALKVLAPELAEDAGFRDRFDRESQIAAAIDHPNIIPIYAAGEADGQLFIAMRFVDGRDLRTLIQAEAPLDPLRTISILSQVASALDAAHAFGMVHRDVKPANILVASGAGPEASDHVYLTDFGLTKRMDSASRRTATGQALGSIDYMAPEQIRGGPLDGRTDVYSLGCVLFECLTGSVPFERDDDLAVLYAHLQEPAPKASERRHQLDRAWDTLLATAMSKKVQDRYASCRVLVEAARGVVHAAARSGSTRAVARPRRAGRGSGGRGLAPDAVGVAPGTRPEGVPPAPPRRPRRGRRWKALAGLGLLALAGAATAAWLFQQGREGSVAPREPSREQAAADIFVVGVDGGAPIRLTTNTALDGSPAWSPDGTRIAFASNREGNVDIYVMDVDGANQVRLTEDEAPDRQPAWSPDGTKLAFVRTLRSEDQSLGTDIWIMNADGSGEHPLLETPEEEAAPAWQPSEGDRLAFARASAADPDNFDLFVVGIDGSGLARLTSVAASEQSPSWSPDGARLVFARVRGGVRNLFLMNADGSNVAQLTDFPTDESGPDWSPDGQRIAFFSDQAGAYQIFVIAPDGTGLRQVTQGSEESFRPSWSPDGQQIAYEAVPAASPTGSAASPTATTSA